MRPTRRLAPTSLARAALLGLGLAAPLSFAVAGVSCSTPSSTIDGGDLMGVFDKDASTSADAAADSRAPKDGGKPPKAPAVRLAPRRSASP